MTKAATVQMSYREWRMLNDRVLIAEDRLRIIRHAVHLRRKLPWWPGKWLKMVKATRAALASYTDGPGDDG